MLRPLADLRIVELAAFVPAPLCGLNLARLGAEVIRIDAIGGGPDANRWPLAPGGASLYWQGLNKGKKSVALNLSNAEGRELAIAVATAPGRDGGSLVTNFPPDGFTSHAALVRQRADMIVVRFTGWGDGSSATDAAVSASLGVAMMAGSGEPGDEPQASAVPIWDLVAANHAAYAFLAAERARQKTGAGTEVRLALADIAMATLADLGMVADVVISGADRPRLGNQLYGGFGRDFITADGRTVLIMALTRRHWTALVKALSLADQIDPLQRRLRVDFADDESARFNYRDELNAIVGRAVSQMDSTRLAAALEGSAVCWAPYNSLSEALRDSVLMARFSSMLFSISHPGGLTYPTPGSPATFDAGKREPPLPAPRLGENTDEVLATVLGLSDGQIGRLHDDGIAAAPPRAVPNA